jgi:hypothetical protein
LEFEGEGNFGFWNKFPGITELADLSFMVGGRVLSLVLKRKAQPSIAANFARSLPPIDKPGLSNGDARQRIPDFSSSPI